MVANNDTVDGLPPVDDKIEIDHEAGQLDPTNEEAQRALAIMNGELDEAGQPVRQAGADDAERKETAYFTDDTRNSITKNWRDSKRGKTEDDLPLDIEGAADGKGPNSRAMIYGTAIAGEGEDAPEKTVEQPAKPTVKVKIAGEEKDVPLDELVASYQKTGTGDKYLADAARDRNQAQALLEGATTKADGGELKKESPASTTETDKASTPKGAKFDRAKVASAVQKIQLGTEEEGTEAFIELLSSVAPQEKSPDISGQVETVLAQRDLSKQSEDATTAFAKKYPDLAKDSIVRQVVGELSAVEMVKDFVEAGLSKETIAKSMPTRAHIKFYHDLARLKAPDEFGRPLTQIYEAVEKAPQFMKLVGGKLPEVQVNLNRGERKVMVQPQPASRTITPQANAQTQNLTREQRMSQRVQAMQKDRGQSVSA